MSRRGEFKIKMHLIQHELLTDKEDNATNGFRTCENAGTERTRYEHGYGGNTDSLVVRLTWCRQVGRGCHHLPTTMSIMEKTLDVK